VYALVGNHDIAYKNTLEVNSPSLLLKDYDNVSIIEDLLKKLIFFEKMDNLEIDILKNIRELFLAKILKIFDEFFQDHQRHISLENQG
jgi:hypothetical protein